MLYSRRSKTLIDAKCGRITLDELQFVCGVVEAVAKGVVKTNGVETPLSG